MAATRQGYAAEMVRKMGDKTNGNVTKLFASPNAKRTLEQVFGRRSDGVFQQIANEKLYDRAVNAVAGNSTTAKQLIDDGSVIEMIGGGVPTGVISSVLRKIAQKRPSKIKKHSEEITKLLLMPASRGFPKMVNPPRHPRGLSRASIHTIQAGEE